MLNSQYHISGPELARVFGLDIRRINQLAKEGIIPRVERGVYDLKDCASAYVAYLRSRGTLPDDLAENPEKLDPRRERARLNKAQADEKEFQNAILKNEYISIQEVRNFETERATVYNAQIDAIPGRYASTIAAKLAIDPAQIYDILLDISLQIRQATSDGFTSLATRSRTEPDNQTTAKAQPSGMGASEESST
jgi:phage terminase Nu1 subunit (DNA packaging protein)